MMYRTEKIMMDIKSFSTHLKFDNDEIKVLYTTEEMAGWNLQELEYATGRVPLYLNWWA